VDREVYSQILTYFYWGNISDCINNVSIFKLKDHKYHVPIYEMSNASGGIQTVLKALELHAYNTNISINNLMNILNQSHSCEFVNEDVYRKTILLGMGTK